MNVDNEIQPDFSIEEVNDSENPMDVNLENEGTNFNCTRSKDRR